MRAHTSLTAYGATIFCRQPSKIWIYGHPVLELYKIVAEVCANVVAAERANRPEVRTQIFCTMKELLQKNG